MSEILDPLKLELYGTCSCERTLQAMGIGLEIFVRLVPALVTGSFLQHQKTTFYVIFYMVTEKAVLKINTLDQCKGSTGLGFDAYILHK